MSGTTHGGFRNRLTLILCVVLHAFTHAYAVMLVPLYLLMVANLHLTGVKRASLLVSLYALVYNIGQYATGILSDRFNRKLLLGAGLVTDPHTGRPNDDRRPSEGTGAPPWAGKQRPRTASARTLPRSKPVRRSAVGNPPAVAPWALPASAACTN